MNHEHPGGLKKTRIGWERTICSMLFSLQRCEVAPTANERCEYLKVSEFVESLPSRTRMYGASMLSVRAQRISSKKRRKSVEFVLDPSMKCGPA